MSKWALAISLAVLSGSSYAQKGNIETVFKSDLHSSGGYGALTNSFSRIRGQFVNISGIYGGWYINHRFMIGAGASAVTSNLPVPVQYRTHPQDDLSYEYGQVGLVTEYVVGSDKPVHLVFHVFAGAGFTLQYQRHNWDQYNGYGNSHDEQWFVVTEPEIQLEVNLLKWMRFSPGVSYRATFGSDGQGMPDSELRHVNFNATLKFGRF